MADNPIKFEEQVIALRHKIQGNQVQDLHAELAILVKEWNISDRLLTLMLLYSIPCCCILDQYDKFLQIFYYTTALNAMVDDDPSVFPLKLG